MNIARVLAFLAAFSVLTPLLAQNEDDNDTVDISIREYDVYCKALGGDSVRICNGLPCSGLIKDFYPNGNLKHKGYYDYGKIATIFSNYYENGKIERNFKSKSDVRGNIEIFYPSGILKSKGEYIKGDALKWEDYYENGQIEFSEEFNKGMDYHLYTRFFYEDGKPQILFELIDEKNRIYSYKEFYEGGQMKEEGKKIQNKSNGDYPQDGVWRFYNAEGKLILEEEYIKGMLNSEKKFY